MTKKADLQQPKASDVFNKFLAENNLVVNLSPFKVRQIDDGSIIIDKPVLVVGYGKPKK